MVETLQYVYTTEAEIKRLMSESSADLQVDDDGTNAPAEAEVWTDVTWQATDEVNMYCQNFYAPETMVNNSWVRRVTTHIAAHLLSQRRGNPGMFTDFYQSALALLERVHNGTLQIPRLPTRNIVVPAVSNFVVDDRYPINKIRVHTPISVGGTYPNQDVSTIYFYDTLF